MKSSTVARVAAAAFGTALLVPAVALPASAATGPTSAPRATYADCTYDAGGTRSVCVTVTPTTAPQWQTLTITGSFSKAARTGTNAKYVKDGVWLYRVNGPKGVQRLNISAPLKADGTFRMPAQLGLTGTYQYFVGVKNAAGSGSDDPPASPAFTLKTTGAQGPTITPIVVRSLPKNGSEVVATHASPVQFRLAANATTGYQWQVDTVRDSAAATVVGPTYVPPKDPIPGKGGTAVVTVDPGHSGLTTLRFRYVGPGGDVATTSTVTVVFTAD